MFAVLRLIRSVFWSSTFGLKVKLNVKLKVKPKVCRESLKRKPLEGFEYPVRSHSLQSELSGSFRQKSFLNQFLQESTV